MPGPSIRDGRPADLDALCEIEARSFAADRLSRRSLKRFLVGDTAILRVAAAGGDILGYHLVLRRAGSVVARLYSIAVAKAARGHGLGERLLADAERAARRRGAAVLRLEVRADNARAVRLYKRRGYAQFGVYRQYYADKADALRFQKRLGPAAGKTRASNNAGDPDEDRSPADFGVSTRLMKSSSLRPVGLPSLVGRHASPPVRGLEA